MALLQSATPRSADDALAAGAAEAAQDALLDMDLGETEGILVNLVEGTIEHKKVA